MQKQLKQVWIPYNEWEDYINGMWKKKVDNESELLQKAIEFTSNHSLYGQAMGEVIHAWPRTMINSLTNPSINQRAFVGHCAVCYRLGIPEYIVRKAWKELTDEQRILADHEATKTIKRWKMKYLTTLESGKKDVIQKGYQMKLQMK